MGSEVDYIGITSAMDSLAALAVKREEVSSGPERDVLDQEIAATYLLLMRQGFWPDEVDGMLYMRVWSKFCRFPVDT